IRYLARNSPLLPDDAFVQAKIDELLFWEQYSHEPYIATTRYQMVYLKRSLQQREAWRVERGEAALDLMEQMLAERRWLVGEAIPMADVASPPYTRLAHQGGFDLTQRGNVGRWISRCEHSLELGPAAT